MKKKGDDQNLPFVLLFLLLLLLLLSLLSTIIREVYVVRNITHVMFVIDGVGILRP